MKVALVHDWLTGMRGGEKVLEVFCEIFPQAEIFTLLCRPEKLSARIRGMKIRTSFIQKLPLASDRYRHYLPLFPRAVESFDLAGFDLVISCSHAVAKGARAPAGVPHLCYCFTPMRYAWFLAEDYFGKNPLKQALLRPFLAGLRRWDLETARGVGRFIAISETVAARIAEIYGRAAEVIHPPVDADFYTPGGERGDYFLVVSALVPYKRVETALEAFKRLGLPLKVAGGGPLEGRLRRLSGGKIEILGWRTNEQLRELYRGCRALVFPGLEDFGIVPLEAMACGRPVIALGRGGLTETVIAPEDPAGRKPTGLFFPEPTPESLAASVRRFGESEEIFRPGAARARAEEFGRGIFTARIREALRPYLRA